MSGWRSGIDRWIPWGRTADSEAGHVSAGGPLPFEPEDQTQDNANVVDPAVLQRAIDGNYEALELLLKKASPILRGRIRRVLAAWGRSNRALEDDILQDLLVALLDNERKALRVFRPERATLRAYLCWWAYFRTIERLRRELYKPPRAEAKQEAGRDDLAPSAQHPQEFMEPDELTSHDLQFGRKLMERFYKDTPPDLLEVFRRLYIDKETPENIAKERGVKLNSITVCRKRLFEQMRKIREDLLTPVPDSRKGRSKKGGGSR